jgi:hypothetical protein
MLRIFKSNVRSVLAGICCAAVVVCGDVSGMLEGTRGEEAGEAKTQTQATANPEAVRKRAFETKENPNETLDSIREYLESIKNSEDPYEKAILEIYTKEDICSSKAAELYEKIITDEDLDNALDGLAFYMKEFVPSGMDFGGYPYGFACMQPLFKLFSRHWECVVKRLTESSINEENLGFVMLLVPEVIDHIDSYGFGTSKLGGTDQLRDWCTSMQADVKALVKIENRMVISLLVHYYKDKFEMLRLQDEIQRLKDRCEEMMW